MTLASHETLPVALELGSNRNFLPSADKRATVSNTSHSVHHVKVKHPRRVTKNKKYFWAVKDFNLRMRRRAVCREVQSEFLCRPERSELGMRRIGHYPLSEGCVDERHTRHERRLSRKGGWA